MNNNGTNDRIEEGRAPDRIALREGSRVVYLPTRDIEWLEAAGNYVRLHAGRTSHLMRETVAALQARLEPDGFLRINRSSMVNLASVRDVRPEANGGFAFHLDDGSCLRSSRRYHHHVAARIGAIR